MNKLLSTTALVLGLSFPMVLSAQTATTTTLTTATGGTAAPGFLSGRSASDVFASELMGHDVHARRTMDATTTAGGVATMPEGTTSVTAGTAATDGQLTATGHGTSGLTTMLAADLESMDNIGQINEIVLSHDGQVRALVIGVGGFLGMGEQDVAVTMDQITFASDPNDGSQMYVVVNTNAEMLKTSPRYERTVMTGDTTMSGNATAQTGMTGNRTPFTAPTMQREGYTPVAVTEMSAEMLTGKAVYGVNDNSVGNIDDLILDDQGAITNVIIDFGGFLGMGTSQVSVGFDELTVLGNEGRDDVRVYIDATKEQVQAQPQYHATN